MRTLRTIALLAALVAAPAANAYDTGSLSCAEIGNFAKAIVESKHQGKSLTDAVPVIAAKELPIPSRRALEFRSQGSATVRFCAWQDGMEQGRTAAVPSGSLRSPLGIPTRHSPHLTHLNPSPAPRLARLQPPFRFSAPPPIDRPKLPPASGLLRGSEGYVRETVKLM
ncbi:MAG: hypothetical protein WBX25_28095 [Rhodomicrobium sp.]